MAAKLDPISDLFATDFSIKKYSWWRWFEKFAKQYCLIFIHHEEDILKLTEQLEKDLLLDQTNQENLVKFHRLKNYQLLFQALKLERQNIRVPLTVDDEIMNQFGKVKDQELVELINFANQTLEAELKTADQENLTLEELYKMVISFYQEKQTRRAFYLEVIAKDTDEINDNYIPLTNKINFNNKMLTTEN